jgi:hypothetical protein
MTLGALAATGPAVIAADAPPPDLCLTIGASLGPSDGEAVASAVAASLAARPVLVPKPHVRLVDPPGADQATRVVVWTEAAGPEGAVPLQEALGAACGPSPGAGAWASSIGGAFLRGGTKRELAAAPTTPGFSSSIDVELDPASDLVRTVLTFSGPLDIPNGTCWMDDVVTADGQGGTRAETTTGNRTSPFGDGVCGRFDEYLLGGGAGAQALVLLPREVALPDGRILRLRIDAVDVREGAIHLTGPVEQGGPS